MVETVGARMPTSGKARRLLACIPFGRANHASHVPGSQARTWCSAQKNARSATPKNRDSALLWMCIHQQAGYHMHRSAGIVYLATFIVALGIFSAVVLDAQRGRSHDRVLPRNPSRLSTNTEQMVVNLSTPPAIRPAEFRDRGQIEPIARHTADAPLTIAPLVIPERAPDASIAPWSTVTVSTSIARILPGKDPKQ